MSIHDGHRIRLKQRYLANGAESLNEHELLELILTYSIPRKNVNPLAHILIDKYGSVESVLSDSVSGLLENEGISYHTAILLKLIWDISRNQLLSRRSAVSRRVVTVRDAMQLCTEMLGRARKESVCTILLNSRSNVVDYYLDNGSVFSVNIDNKKLLSRVLDSGASAVIIGHTHPSGQPKPSAADSERSEALGRLLAQIGVALYDHIIVTDDDCYAMLHDVRQSDFTSNNEDKSAKPRLLG